MHIFLTILKVIGIIILVLLGILLFLVLTLLLDPIRYYAEGRFKDFSDYEGKFTFRWLYGIVSVKGRYQEELEYVVRVFGIPIFREEARRAEDKVEPEEMFDADREAELDALEQELKQEEEEEAPFEEPIFEEEEPELQATEVPPKKRKIFHKPTKKKTPKKEKKPSVLAKIREEWEREENKRVVNQCLVHLKYLLKHYQPRKINIQAEFSAGDPCYTGWITAFFSMIPAIYQEPNRVYPDFESEEIYFHGTFKLKGRIRLVHLGIVLFRMFREKSLSYLISRFKN